LRDSDVMTEEDHAWQDDRNRQEVERLD
jgi:hypothetical protein